MHQSKSEYPIAEENSSFDSSTPQQYPNKRQSHLHTQIPLTKSHFQHEITLTSTLHETPMMTQSFSHSPTFSSLNNHQINQSFNLESFPHSLSCFSLATNSSARKLVQALCRFCLLRFHLRFLILFSLPSLYFFFTNLHQFSLLSFLSILAFSITFIVISLNLALPLFPALRLLLSRSLPIKFASLNSSSLKEPLRPVVWSIGSKPKLSKNPISGSSVKVYSNGDVYEGEFHRGKSSGSGVYYYYKKGKYEGDWIDGKYDGYGVETWVRGSRYRGQYKQGLRDGIGVYRFYTGDVYAGEWSNGQCHGCGVHTCVDGSIYVGEFKWGVKHGFGHYHFRNGDTYSGEYFADRMHGFGVYQFGNGHRYEGAWHEGRRQGLGMYTFRSGEIQCGHWQNGVLDVPSTQNTFPRSPYPVNHFKVLNAVQEAQRVAAKAYDIAKVEERVNKVVAAANKAANAARVASVKAVQNQRHDNDCDDTPSHIDS